MSAESPQSAAGPRSLYPRELRIRVSSSMEQRIMRQAAQREMGVSAMARQAFERWLQTVEKVTP